MVTDFSLVRLFILGLLDSRPRYGYEIVAVAELWAVHRWGGISIGSIYHSLGKLAKEGHVVQGKVEKPGNRPERHVWEVTPSGRLLARKYVEYGLASLDFEGREIDMALAFAHLVSPEVRVSRLNQRIGPVTERLNQLRAFHRGYQRCEVEKFEGFEEYQRLKREQPWIAASVAHGLGRLEHEHSWTLQLINDVNKWPTAPALAEVGQ
jgi:DNA-binding PadR family transcriptional regulator